MKYDTNNDTKNDQKGKVEEENRRKYFDCVIQALGPIKESGFEPTKENIENLYHVIWLNFVRTVNTEGGK